MENENTQQQFPDSELVKFAEYFSENYKTLEAGTYLSEGGKYTIEYVEKIEHSTNSRVDLESGVMQLDKNKLCTQTWSINLRPDFIFFLVIWLGYFPREGEIAADEAAIKFYLTTGRSKLDIVIGYTESLECNPCEQSARRIENVTKLLDK